MFKIVTTKIKGTTTDGMRAAIEKKFEFLDTDNQEVKVTVEPAGKQIKTSLSFVDKYNHHYRMSESNPDFTLSNCPETETIQGARGANASANVHIHSVRMPGYIASQEVIFGASGQILTIRHDSMDRTCYMSGILMAVRYIAEHKDFIYGLENIL